MQKLLQEKESKDPGNMNEITFIYTAQVLQNSICKLLEELKVSIYFTSCPSGYSSPTTFQYALNHPQA
jgi:hypothetical protein